MESKIRFMKVAQWIVCLAFLAVGARNFEPGLTMDSPVYAAIARQIARSHEWFYLDSGLPDFTPFVDHPHLGMWWVALTFCVLPAVDWAARIPGHVFYVAFLLLFFFMVKKFSGQKTAVGTVLLLWIWGAFSNFFSAVYLDPGALFFGTAALFSLAIALEQKKNWLGLIAGISLGLSVMTKGLMAVGFVPSVVFLFFLYRKHKIGGLVRTGMGALFSFTSLLILYYFLVRHSSVPDFFERYWSRQVTHRFGPAWSFWGIVNPYFWKKLLVDTYYLAVLIPLAYVSKKRNEVVIPSLLLASFVAIYAPNDRIGGQYWLTVLPWMAWLISLAVSDFLIENPARWMKASGTLAVAAVLFIQYLPIPTHKMHLPMEVPEISSLRAKGHDRLWLDTTTSAHLDFLMSAPYAWYSDVSVRYATTQSELPSPEVRDTYLLLEPNADRKLALKQKGWCLAHDYSGPSLWIRCPRGDEGYRTAH